MTTVAHEANLNIGAELDSQTDELAGFISVKGIAYELGRRIAPTPEKIAELRQLGQTIMATYLDAEGKPATRPGGPGEPPLRPAKGASQAERDAYHENYAEYLARCRQPADPVPIPPAIGQIEITDNTGYYTLIPHDETAAYTQLPYENVGTAQFEVRELHEIVE